MTVSTILAEKGKTVITAATTDTIADICDVLAKNRIGAVVVIDTGGLIAGIVSERDIVRAISESGTGALTAIISSVMTSTVVTCRQEDAITTVMAHMSDGRFRHVPVVDDDKLIGVISIGDVVKYRIAQAEREAEEMRAYITTA